MTTNQVKLLLALAKAVVRIHENTNGQGLLSAAWRVEEELPENQGKSWREFQDDDTYGAPAPFKRGKI